MRSTDNRGFTEELGWSQPQFDSRCLCWWKCRYIDIICPQDYGISNQSSSVSWKWPRDVPSERAYKAESSSKSGCSSEFTISKTPVALHDSSLPTTSLQIGSDRLWFWTTSKKREAEAIFFHKWLEPTDFRSWQINFKSEFGNVPETLLVKLRMLKVLTISLLQHL